MKSIKKGIAVKLQGHKIIFITASGARVSFTIK